MEKTGVVMIEKSESEIILETHRSVDPFLRLPSSTIKDRSIGWRGLGMLVYMLDLPADWKFRLNHLAGTRKRVGHGNGRDAVSAVLKELQEAGYLLIEIQRKNGRFDAQVWHVADRPIFKSNDEQGSGPETDSPGPAKSKAEIPDGEKPTLHTRYKKHYSSPLESGVERKIRRSSAGFGAEGKKKHVFLLDPATNIHFEQGNLPDAQALALIGEFPTAQIEEAVVRAQRLDDRGRAFPSATLRALRKMSGCSSGEAPAWATMDQDSLKSGSGGVCFEGEFMEEKE